MANEDTLLEEAMDNLKEAGQRIRATQSLLRSEGMTGGENYRDLLTRLSTALAMTQGDFHQRRIDKAHRRYLSSIKALAQIRKMGPAVQINIAEKQINTSG